MKNKLVEIKEQLNALQNKASEIKRDYYPVLYRNGDLALIDEMKRHIVFCSVFVGNVIERVSEDMPAERFAKLDTEEVNES